MDSRLQNISEQTQLLPASDTAKQAIANGALESKTAAQQGAQEVAKSDLIVKPLSREDVY